MTIGGKKVTFQIDGYGKPTPKKIKRFADALLSSMPVWIGIIAASPITSPTKEWVMTGISFVFAFLKLVSNLFVEES